MTDDFLTEMGLLTGWKRIADFLGVSKRTARRWAKYGLPVRNWPGGRPWAMPYELVLWGTLFDEKKKEHLKTSQTGPNGVKKGQKILSGDNKQEEKADD